MAAIEKKALSVEEAAAALGISRSLAYNMVRAGKIPARRLGKRWLISSKALDRFLEDMLSESYADD